MICHGNHSLQTVHIIEFWVDMAYFVGHALLNQVFTQSIDYCYPFGHLARVKMDALVLQLQSTGIFASTCSGIA